MTWIPASGVKNQSKRESIYNHKDSNTYSNNNDNWVYLADNYKYKKNP